MCWGPACGDLIVPSVVAADTLCFCYTRAAAAFRVVALRKGSQIVAVATLRCVSEQSGHVGVRFMRHTAQPAALLQLPTTC